MVEAVGQNFGDLGLSADGMSFSNEKGPEQDSAMERGREFLNNQLAELKASENYDKWVDVFNRNALSAATWTTLKIVDVLAVLNNTPVGANIDDIGDVMGIAICFLASPAWTEIKKIGKQIFTEKEAA